MKLKYDLVLFDLDGTLSHSNPGVKESLIYTLNTLKIAVPPQIDMPHTYMGPPLMDTFQNLFGMKRETALAAAEIYKDYYVKKGKYSNSCFSGTADMLKILKQSGVKLAVASTKLEPFAKEVLEIIGLDGYFDAVCGSSEDGRIKDKAQVIALALKRLGMESGKNIVLIGDSVYDVEGANTMGIDFIGVTYGYGLKEDMTALGAKIFADSTDEVLTLLGI